MQPTDCFFSGMLFKTCNHKIIDHEKRKKSTTDNASTNKPQTGADIKKGLPVKTPATDVTKNIASQTPGTKSNKNHKR